MSQEQVEKKESYVSIDVGVPQAEIQTFASAVPISSVVPAKAKPAIAEPSMESLPSNPNAVAAAFNDPPQRGE